MRRAIATRVGVLISAVLVVAAASTQYAAAAEIEGVHFADEIRSASVTMRVRCVGLLRYRVIFRA